MENINKKELKNLVLDLINTSILSTEEKEKFRKRLDKKLEWDTEINEI